MPILEMRTAKQTSAKERDEWVTELSSGIKRFRSGGVAAAALDRTMGPISNGVETVGSLFQTAPRILMLILRRPQECQINIQAYSYRLARWCA
jgi:hypothetical protein